MYGLLCVVEFKYFTINYTNTTINTKLQRYNWLQLEKINGIDTKNQRDKINMDLLENKIDKSYPEFERTYKIMISYMGTNNVIERIIEFERTYENYIS